MATKKKTNETETATETLQEIVQPKFTIDRLAVDCKKLFGISSCTYAGATHGMTGEYTVDEMKAHIKKWCGTEVK